MLSGLFSSSLRPLLSSHTTLPKLNLHYGAFVFPDCPITCRHGHKKKKQKNYNNAEPKMQNTLTLHLNRNITQKREFGNRASPTVILSTHQITGSHQPNTIRPGAETHIILLIYRRSNFIKLKKEKSTSPAWLVRKHNHLRLLLLNGSHSVQIGFFATAAVTAVCCVIERVCF